MPWVPRLWHGMTAAAWLRLLCENRFAVTPTRIPMALGVSAVSVANSIMAGTQSLVCGRRIARTSLRDDPVFVIGHWRSGTTLLHELLSLDSRHAYPDTYACLAPSHFLISRFLVPWWLGFLMPKRRPMDNVCVGWKQPQEDEWALCVQGLPTLYRMIAFPRRFAPCPDSLTVHELPGAEIQRWNQSLLHFLKCVMVGQESSRLVLKSPPHTARIAHLTELFPHARFVHVVRDPMVVFPSSMRLWTRLATDHGLQLPRQEDLELFVLDTFVQMYDAFESQRARLPSRQICDVRYEQLVADPVGQIERVYRHLELGEFEAVRPALERRAATMSDYQVNRYQVSDQQRQWVQQRWGDFSARYGYAAAASCPAPSVPSQRKAG